MYVSFLASLVQDLTIQILLTSGNFPISLVLDFLVATKIPGAEPSSVNHAGFSPWMVVAEVDADPSPRADDIRECLELLKPKMLPEELLQAEMPEETQL